MIVEILTLKESLAIRISEIEGVCMKEKVVDGKIGYFLRIWTKSRFHTIEYGKSKMRCTRNYFKIIKHIDPDYDLNKASK